MLLSAPNHLFPYEHHTGRWMLPGGPKWLVAWQLRRKGQDPAFIQHLQFGVNALSVRRWLRTAGDNVSWVDLNHARVRRIMSGIEAPRSLPAVAAQYQDLYTEVFKACAA
jgi:hypothetical protein